MEDDLHKPPFQERNPITHRVHKREVFWQITLPVIIGGVIVLLIAVGVLLTTARGTGNTSDWADASLVLMIIPTMFSVFLLMVILAGMVFLITRLLGVSPFFFRRVQDFFTLASLRVGRAADAAVEPFLRGHSFVASVRALGRKKRG